MATSSTSGSREENATPKILVLGDLEYESSRQYLDALAEELNHTIVTPKATKPDDFLAECRSGRFAGAKAAFRSFDSVKITGRIEGEVVKALGKDGVGIRFLCHAGAGYDQLSIPDLTEAGILASNAPTAPAVATADTALFLLLGTLRNFTPGMVALRRGEWRGQPAPVATGHDPTGKTLGIIGMGNIGRELARRALPLGMKLAYWSRRGVSAEDLAASGLPPDGVRRYEKLEDLLATSDVVSVHLPLNKETRTLLPTSLLRTHLKRGAILINTSRGPLLPPSTDLLALLHDGIVGGLGLDVYEHEPHVEPELCDVALAGSSKVDASMEDKAWTSGKGRYNVVLLPHMGTWTDDTQAKIEGQALENVGFAVREGRLRDGVPEQRGVKLE